MKTLWSNFRPASLVALAIALGALSLTGCSNLTTVLDGVMIATAAAPGAVVALEAAGTITPDVGNQILNVAQIVNEDCSKALVEASSTDTPSQMASVIAADFSNVPAAIPGLPPQAAAIVGGIIAAVDAVLAAVNAPQSARPTAAKATSVKPLPPHALKISASKALELQGKIAETRAAINKAKK